MGYIPVDHELDRTHVATDILQPVGVPAPTKPKSLEPSGRGGSGKGLSP